MKMEEEFKKFAKQFNKEDNQELLMYFKAGWIAAIDEALQLIKEQAND